MNDSIVMSRLPHWVQEWLGTVIPVGQVLLILLGAWVLQRLMRRLIQRLGDGYFLPRELVIGTRRVSGFLVYTAALLLVLEHLGVSGDALWTAVTGFAAVAAVAFFAAWSVLSNIFCTILIFTSRPFRLYDYIELVDSSDKPGPKGQVIDINLIYTTLQEAAPHDGGTGALLQVPNSLFFQRTIRRWRSSVPPAWLARTGEERP